MQKLKRMAQGFGVLACFLFISVGAHAQATNDDILDAVQELDAFVEEVQDQIEDLIEEEFAGLNSANIEKCLQKNVKIASVYLPEANGGQQTLVFMIVQNTINNVLASGESVGAAQSLLNGAINLAGMGQHKQAWNYASNAYQAATN